MKERLNQAIVTMPASGIRRVTEAARAIDGCISLALGEPAFDTPEPIREATKKALDGGLTHYPPNMGLPALRERIAAFEAGRGGGSIGAQNVLITCGSTEALACALLGVVEPGDEVIVPTPAFGLYAQQLQIARGVCVPLQTSGNAFQIDPGALERVITPRTKAIVLNSPNNPTGVQYTQASIEAVEEVCLRLNLFVIYDAVYDRLSFSPPAPRPSAEKLGGRLICCNAFSKPYAMTGWRVGYCIAAAEIMPQLCKVHAALTVGVSTFSQAGCLDIFDVDTEWMRLAYRDNRDLVVRRLGEMDMEVVRPEGAFYAFPSIAAYGLEEDVFVDRLMREHGVAVVPGGCFGAPGFVRISYCCDERTLAGGLDRLEAFVKTL